MSKHFNSKISLLKKLFSILLIIDSIGLISLVFTLIPDFNDFAEYGEMMLGIVCIIAAVMVAVQLFDILAKVYLIRSLSSLFSSTSGKKIYVFAALLIFVNLGALLINVLSVGGEGATLMNQTRIYIQILASIVEIVCGGFYLHLIKRI